jgi:alpha-glucuronidase
MHSGRTLWDELALHYQTGVDTVRAMRREWQGVRGSIDAPRFAEVDSFLEIQEREARWWRDAALQYFASFSHMPLPAGVEPPAHPLSYYMSLPCPRDPRKPRCPEIQ